MKTAAPCADRRPLQSTTGARAEDLSTIVKQPFTGAEDLMPYEAAAKAIFVKANGLSAYYKATGTVGCAE